MTVMAGRTERAGSVESGLMSAIGSELGARRASAGMASEHCLNVTVIELALHKGKVSPFIVCFLILRWKNVNLCYK